MCDSIFVHFIAFVSICLGRHRDFYPTRKLEKINGGRYGNRFGPLHVGDTQMVKEKHGNNIFSVRLLFIITSEYASAP